MDTIERTLSPAQRKEHWRSTVQALFQIEDTRGIELFSALNRAAHLSEALEGQPADDQEVSPQRFRLLLTLLFAEQHGQLEGLTPTEISKRQRVTKNTTSALLRGLEEQGLVERLLDARDRRLFRIHLTPAGREMVLEMAPKRLKRLNRMLDIFSAGEVEALTGLLERLLGSLYEQVRGVDCHAK